MNSSSHIALLLLAAGGSARMGKPKQLLAIENEALVQRMAGVALATNCRPVAVVLGANFTKVAPLLAGLPLGIVDNEDWQEGMGSSISAGIRWVEERHPQTDAALLMLCDQPLVSLALLDHIARIWQHTGAPVVACEYGGTVGVPALFDKSLFADLKKLGGAEGAKTVIKANRERMKSVPFPEGEIDLDTPEDYEKWVRAGT